jgi:hypothetical protein
VLGCRFRWGETTSVNCYHQQTYCSSPRWFMSMENDGGMILTRENRRTRRKTRPNSTLSTTNLTWIDPGANPGLRGEIPTTNTLSHGTANRLVSCLGFSHYLVLALKREREMCVTRHWEGEHIGCRFIRKYRQRFRLYRILLQ